MTKENDFLNVESVEVEFSKNIIVKAFIILMIFTFLWDSSKDRIVFKYPSHSAGTSEISDLCGNISNFRLNVSLWQEVDIASFFGNFF